MIGKIQGAWLRKSFFATILAGVSGHAMAGRSIQVVDFFYTDDAHTGQYVGETIYGCGSQPTTVTGQSTPFVVQVETDCEGPYPAADADNALPTTFHNCYLTMSPYESYICSG
jgi:hypothetical protein